MAKQMTQIQNLAKSLNFEIEKTAKGHILFRGYGQTICFSGTTCNYTALIKIKNNLNKIAAGLTVARF